MDNIKIPATRATAIAAANAVVVHLKLGLFISEFKLGSRELDEDYKLAGNVRVSMEGRTNTGTYVMLTGAVIFKKDRSGQFPIDKVFVTFHGPYMGNMTFYECTFSEQIEVRELKESPDF